MDTLVAEMSADPSTPPPTSPGGGLMKSVATHVGPMAATLRSATKDMVTNITRQMAGKVRPSRNQPCSTSLGS